MSSSNQNNYAKTEIFRQQLPAQNASVVPLSKGKRQNSSIKQTLHCDEDKPSSLPLISCFGKPELSKNSSMMLLTSVSALYLKTTYPGTSLGMPLDAPITSHLLVHHPQRLHALPMSDISGHLLTTHSNFSICLCLSYLFDCMSKSGHHILFIFIYSC